MDTRGRVGLVTAHVYVGVGRWLMWAMRGGGIEVHYHIRYGKGWGIHERKRHVGCSFQSTRRFDPTRTFLSCTKQNNVHIQHVMFCFVEPRKALLGSKRLVD